MRLSLPSRADGAAVAGRLLVVCPSCRLLRHLTGAAGLVVLLGTMMIAGIAVGARPLAPGDVWQALWHADGGRTAIIVWQLRLPRTLIGAVVGASLGVAGALTQALGRNPLAEPGLLGVNAGASLAVVTGISLAGADGLAGQAGFAILGAMLAAAGLAALDRLAPAGRQGVRLVLIGAAISASIRALTGIITMSNSAVFDSYRFWVVGSLNRPAPAGLPFFLLGLLVLVTVVLFWGRRLNALALGLDLMQALGLPIVATRLRLFAAIVLLCGGATALAGPIAFLGLAAPHLARLMVGADWRWILPYAALLGAVLLISADVLGRIVALPGELEAGIVIAFLGAPLLLWLVGRQPA